MPSFKYIVPAFMVIFGLLAEYTKADRGIHILTLASAPDDQWMRGGSSSPFRSPPRKTPSRSAQSEFSPRLHRRQSPTSDNTPEDTKDIIDAFLTRDSRNSFIARVYSILGLQLFITAASCVLFGLHPALSSISESVRNGRPSSPIAYIPMLGIFASTVAWFRVSLSPDARRKSPNKWWWLGIFTIGESVAVAFLTSFYRFQSVVLAMGATALSTTTVSLYTVFQNNPNRDLSQIGASLSSWAVILIVYSIVGLLQESGVLPAGMIPFSDFIYSGFAAILFSAFLAYHTKLIVGGKHSKYRMNEKDYVYGAMALYSDIVSIFINILQLIGEDKDVRR